MYRSDQSLLQHFQDRKILRETNNIKSSSGSSSSIILNTVLKNTKNSELQYPICLKQSTHESK